MIIAQVMQNKCAEIKIRAERRAGELLKDMEEKGEVADRGRPEKTSHDVNLNGQPASLLQDEIGIPRMERHRYKTLANRRIGADHCI